MIAEVLPPEAQVAIGYARAADRPTFAAMLELDRALARAVAGASEPIVGQMRLAWWRDALAAPDGELPQGGPLYDQLVVSFGAQRSQLVRLVDGWEALFLADPLDDTAIDALCEGRVLAWEATATAIDVKYSEDLLAAAARCWALADLAANLPSGPDKALVLDRPSGLQGRPHRLPRNLRPLIILAVLGDRSLKAGGQPMLADRRSAAIALRVGMFGR